MTKADTIRLLHAERCSVEEIAAAVGWTKRAVREFIRTSLIKGRVDRVFCSWRGYPLGSTVISF